MFSSMDVPFRIPESKQHMVLPEIEEEAEDLNQRHSKLSLTSLLLGKVYTMQKINFKKQSVVWDLPACWITFQKSFCSPLLRKVAYLELMHFTT